ncbi:MAG: hypothetical protein HY021_11980 [Burkholderiales bacterium]|nr:hypothetical protein [Burkholderiales bacterium]
MPIMHVVTLSGSPSSNWRSAWLLRHAAAQLSARIDSQHEIDLRALPAARQ